MKQVYIFLANGFEEIEAITIIDVLRRANILAVTCSITQEYQVTGAHGITFVVDKLFQDLELDSADMYVLPGGMPGTTNLKNFTPLKELLSEQYRKGKTIAAICAAPLVLGEIGILQNQTVTCYPGFETFLKGANVTGKKVEISGRIITGNGPGSAMAFSLELVAFLKDKNKKQEVTNQLYCTSN